MADLTQDGVEAEEERNCENKISDFCWGNIESRVRKIGENKETRKEVVTAT